MTHTVDIYSIAPCHVQNRAETFGSNPTMIFDKSKFVSKYDVIQKFEISDNYRHRTSCPCSLPLLILF